MSRRSAFWVILAFAVAQIALGAAIWKSQYEQGQAAEQADARAECVTDILVDFGLAVNERTTYTELLSDSEVEQSKAFAALVQASLREPPPGEAEAREIVVTYDKALDRYLEIAQKAQTSRQNNPYPTVADIKACR